MRKFLSSLYLGDDFDLWFDPAEVVAVVPYVDYLEADYLCIDIHLRSGHTLCIYRDIYRPEIGLDVLTGKFVDLLGDKFGLFLPEKHEGEIEVVRVTN